MGSTGRRLAAEISIDFWTTHAEWMAQEEPRHLVLGQEHRLEAGRCEEEVGKLERQGWRCGFSPAKRNALKAKSDSSLATSAGTFVAEWVWLVRRCHRASDAPREAHHGKTHGVQCLLLPHGGVYRAQPSTAGGNEP